MASRAQSITVTFVAWDTSASAPKTGDVANFTLRVVKDGTSAVPTNSPAEVDATNAPGVYKLVLSAAECTADCVTVCGKSSTASVSIIPTTITFEQLPTAAPNANAGLPILSSSGTTLAYTFSTLTTLPTAPTDWLSAAAVSAAAATKIANAVEAEIIDETDSEKVLTAITDKIASVNPSLSGLTLAAITSSVWTGASRTLTSGANIVLAKGTGVTGFNDLSAVQVNTEADSALSDVGLTTTVTGRIDLAISSRAATGSAMTLTLGERDSIAASLLDLAAGVEANLTVRQYLRLAAAVLLGKSSNNGATFRDTNDTKDRIVATVDSSSNRTAITRDST